jgi:two-component system, NtrC family, response regulator HydG
MKEKLLIVEDQFVEASNLQRILEQAGYAVCGVARSVPVALEIIEKEGPDLVLLDIHLQGTLTGIDLGRILKEKNIAFVYLSANSNKETLEAAKATHPYGFLVKPFREKDVLVMLDIAHYLHQYRKQSLSQNDQNKLKVHSGKKIEENFYGIIGKSAVLARLIRELELVAPTDTAVLILGESGTGKERIAECIHLLSERKNNKLVKVNCATLPASLTESALFGHERGAFTGATERKIGKFEQADKGTIFLDEIGELSLDLQSKLLRVLQEKEIERVGGTTTINVDVRVIAATNRNLEQEVAAGNFRMDLYYRLHVFPVLVPPLRERREDIPLLTHHFIDKFSKKIGKTLLSIADLAMKDLMLYDWPGNVRELEHIIERAVLLAPGEEINHIELPRIANNIHSDSGKTNTMQENERQHIVAVLKQCNGKIFGNGGAAELLGIPPSTLNSRIKKLGINKSKLIF